MVKTMKLMADYQCFPLWEYSDNNLIDNVNPEDLPLTAALKGALREWASAMDKTLNQEYPPDSGFASPQEEVAFEAEGKRLWKELQEQLGPAYRVVYYSSQEARLLE